MPEECTQATMIALRPGSLPRRRDSGTLNSIWNRFALHTVQVHGGKEQRNSAGNRCRRPWALSPKKCNIHESKWMSSWVSADESDSDYVQRRISNFGKAKRAIQRCQSFDQLFEVLVNTYPGATFSFHHVLTALGAVAHHRPLRKDALSTSIPVSALDGSRRRGQADSSFEATLPSSLHGLNFMLLSFSRCLQRELDRYNAQQDSAYPAALRDYCDAVLASVTEIGVPLRSSSRQISPQMVPVYVGYAAHILSRLRGTLNSSMYELEVEKDANTGGNDENKQNPSTSACNNLLFLQLHALVLKQLLALFWQFFDQFTPRQLGQFALAVAHCVRPWKSPKVFSSNMTDAGFIRSPEDDGSTAIRSIARHVGCDNSKDLTTSGNLENGITEQLRNQIAVLRACILMRFPMQPSSDEYFDLLKVTTSTFAQLLEFQSDDPTSHPITATDAGIMTTILSSHLYNEERNNFLQFGSNTEIKSLLHQLLEISSRGSMFDEKTFCHWLPVFAWAARVSYRPSKDTVHRMNAALENYPTVVKRRWTSSQLANVHTFLIDSCLTEKRSSSKVNEHRQGTRTLRKLLVNDLSLPHRLKDLKRAKLERLLLECCSDPVKFTVGSEELLSIAFHIAQVNSMEFESSKLDRLLQQSRLTKTMFHLLQQHRQIQSDKIADIEKRLYSQLEELRSQIETILTDRNIRKPSSTLPSPFFEDVHHCLIRSGFSLPRLDRTTHLEYMGFPTIPGEGSHCIPLPNGFVLDFAFLAMQENSDKPVVFGIKLLDPFEAVRACGPSKGIVLSAYAEQYMRFLRSEEYVHVKFIDTHKWKRLRSKKNKRQLLRRMLCGSGVPFSSRTPYFTAESTS